MTPLDEGSALRRDLWQHTTLTTDIHPWPPRDLNPQFQKKNRGRGPNPQTARLPESNSLLWNRPCPKRASPTQTNGSPTEADWTNVSCDTVAATRVLDVHCVGVVVASCRVTLRDIRATVNSLTRSSHLAFVLIVVPQSMNSKCINSFHHGIQIPQFFQRTSKVLSVEEFEYYDHITAFLVWTVKQVILVSSLVRNPTTRIPLGGLSWNFYCCGFFQNVSRKFRVLFKTDKITGTLHEYYTYIYNNISLNPLNVIAMRSSCFVAIIIRFKSSV
jgi:hypothetical protein